MAFSRRACLSGVTVLGAFALSRTVRASDEGCGYEAEHNYPVFRPIPDASQAPFGELVSPSIGNYNRVSPYVGTAGLLLDGGVAVAKRLGFRLILDLRGQNEQGVAEEAQIARSKGIDYLNIPVTTRAPTREQVAWFKGIVEKPTNYPILLHCVSANRTGAMWALYRASRGVPPLIAIEEGRTAGLTSRENAVRQMLGLLEL